MKRIKRSRKVKPIRVALDARLIGARIAKARRSHRETQEWLSRKIGQNPGQKLVANYETGRRIPSLRTLCNIAVALHRSLEWLLFGLAKRSEFYRGPLTGSVRAVSTDGDATDGPPGPPGDVGSVGSIRRK